MSVTLKAPHDLRALLATMKSAKDQGVHMAIWDRDIKAVEDAIETIDGIRALAPAQGAEVALRNLVERLEFIHEDPAFQSVWTVSHIHIGPYTGPTYVDALNEAKRVLATTSTDAPAQDTGMAAPGYRTGLTYGDGYKAAVEQCAKIADPWPGFNVGQKISEPDLSVIEVRTKIAAVIRALEPPSTGRK